MFYKLGLSFLIMLIIIYLGGQINLSSIEEKAQRFWKRKNEKPHFYLRKFDNKNVYRQGVAANSKSDLVIRNPS